jgi:K+-transporting ATPase ATPase C chain
MDNKNNSAWIISQTITSFRTVIATMMVCCLFYGIAVLSFARTASPENADGSLLYNQQGEVIGSELIAQGFSRPEYFWPRPSAVNYNASASGGSNLSPANIEVRSRAKSIMASMGVAEEKKIPADLVAASGSGLDPHISLDAARYQSERVAIARGLSLNAVIKLIDQSSKQAGGAFNNEKIVNVLLLNMALDRMDK